uniref:Layilin-like isoform X1 n=1 Tax=Saccoglossus kowalevskii TaxID=10224 RepID=A0ABM0GPJ6_SACKO|nr:PREDICTED: layilin-like isoform X1 [Saccoglossus kowalevskii]
MLRLALCFLCLVVGTSAVYEVYYQTSRFVIYTDKMDWQSARAYCEEEGGRLAVFDLKAEDKTVRQYILADPDLKSAPGGGYWIGCQDLHCEGVFSWVNGKMLSETWTHWYAGPPTAQPNNNPDQPGGQDCCQMWKKPQNSPVFHWDDDFCDTEKGFVCEYRHEIC